MFSSSFVCLFVCLLVSRISDIHKMDCGGAGHDAGKHPLHFGADPDNGTDPENFFSLSLTFSTFSLISQRIINGQDIFRRQAFMSVCKLVQIQIQIQIL